MAEPKTTTKVDISPKAIKRKKEYSTLNKDGQAVAADVVVRSPHLRKPIPLKRVDENPAFYIRDGIDNNHNVLLNYYEVSEQQLAEIKKANKRELFNLTKSK